MYIYRRANGIYIYTHPKKLQFAAYGQFVLVLYRDKILNYIYNLYTSIKIYQTYILTV